MKEALVVALGLIVVKKKLLCAIALFGMLMVQVTVCSPRTTATEELAGSAPHGAAVQARGE